MADDAAPDDTATSSSLERLVEQALRGPALDGDENGPAPAPQKVRAVAQLLLQESYKGVFPHPEVLRRLDEVVANGAERAFALTEREQQHRHDNDNRMISAEIKESEKAAFDRRLVIVLIFLFLGGALTLSFIAAMTDHLWASGIAGATGLIVAATGLLRLSSRSRDDNPST